MHRLKLQSDSSFIVKFRRSRLDFVSGPSAKKRLISLWHKCQEIIWCKNKIKKFPVSLGIYPKKTIIQKESCTTAFTAALFTIARTWKQPKCPSTDEWIKKMWHIYTMEYYSAIKRNKIELFVVRWMELESVIQSEVSQKEKNKYCMLTHIYGI